jgi:nitrogen regulatory protein PII-like uncharacterized protein
VTGFYVRVYRDGWQNLEIDELNREELLTVLEDVSTAKAVGWIVALVEWIQANVKEAPEQGGPS